MTLYQAPTGTRDWLPLEVAQKSWIAERLQQVFQQWGYQPIVTSTIEGLDALMAGGAIQRSSVLQLQETEEGTLGLRPELTASIARAAATRMAGHPYPQRLYYHANVFRRSRGHHGRQIEFYQAGVELLGTGSTLADAEILLLLADCLERLDLPQWHLIVGEASLTRSLLAPFPPELQQQVRYSIAHLDRVALQALPLSPALRDRALQLFDLRGEPEAVLQQLADLELDAATQQTVSHLQSLVALLRRSCAQPLPLTLDLSLLQTMDYYTGIVFDAVNATATDIRSFGQGGRYDRLLELYHPQGQGAPGIGFALNLEDLHACLLAADRLPRQTAASDWLVIPQAAGTEAAALNYAHGLRQRSGSARVELDLGERSPQDIRAYARACAIAQLAWVSADGSAQIETL